MKNSLFRILVMLLAVGLLGFGKLYAQESTPKVDSIASFKGKYTSDSLKTGVWKFYYANGKLASRQKYKPYLVQHIEYKYDSAFTEVLSVDTTNINAKVGRWKGYSKEGKLVSFVRFDRKSTLRRYRYYYNGVLTNRYRSRSKYVYKQVFYYENGRIRDYCNNPKFRRCLRKKWDESGKLIYKDKCSYNSRKQLEKQEQMQ